MKNLNVHLSDEFHKRFKITCVQEGKDMAEVVRKLIADYVEKVEKKPKR
jgi:predicted DNA-binding protein